MRQRRSLAILFGFTAAAAIPLVALRGAEVQMVTVALILALATVLQRARATAS